MPTLKRKPDTIHNKVCSSIKFLCTIKAIDTDVDIVQKSIRTLSSSNKNHHQDMKCIIRSIQD